MRRFRNHLIGVQQGSRVMFSDFEDDGVMWTGKGPREVRVTLQFDEPFKTVPVIVTALAMFDIDAHTNQRADLSHGNVTETQFDLIFRTWGDTRVARVRADWTAIGEIRAEDEWDLY
ncbi:H-type lectin domain-containing protein [Jannaschia sp. GRR-S6-38]|uniref:H-type lectin domain-containing protein n=2 Tax=Jannaschia ovalis TaxID=3038773 RepID=A0ABY8LIU5_9RHOB|nr:H-type lectin domain-containing protein [Jannaschia sp. GRR-S6-38]WGH80340.1 H-type lectin domain-containing protein [Jannaschia sp. GRR-S6-38]